ncbi:ester cyclase [Streptomyces kaniharaensis]|uniref:Ester cyclase n=1 Tax=Streptomyces kaniharaensis TaxID=212423 RepID=A0A6N7KV91_9ACTN|nr:ester cyclase [Streptomyces kaniharaensis]MQS15546.1 ester cyclase [Streptomyces kaniharaensis]
MSKAERTNSAGLPPSGLKDLVEQIADRVWNRGDLAAVDEHFRPDFVGHLPGVAELRGPAVYRRVAAERRRALPDLRYRPLHCIGDGDRVMLRSEVLGTHLGRLGGIPPTGMRVRTTEMTIFRFEDGRVAELWQQGDDLGVLDQLGLVPPAGLGALGRVGHAVGVTARLTALTRRAARERKTT